MKKQNMNKHYQKQSIKKEYAAARNAGSQTAGTATKSTGKKLSEKASDKIKEFFEKNKKVFIWIGVGVALLVLLGAGISSCSMLTSTGSSVIASSYLSEDDAMLGAEAQYCQMEQELQRYLDTYESTHDYDEYHFDLDDIEHDPYVLISILSALHEGEFTLDEVQGTLQMLFEKQYILTEEVIVETRYRTETDTWTDADGNTHTETYRVPYDYYICNVKLENFNLSHVPVYIMSQEQLSIEFGKGQWNGTGHRIVSTMFDLDNAPQSNLVMGEVFNQPGRWSSYPPHHHPQPEVYYYQFDHPEGFGAGFEGDTPYKTQNGDCLCIRGGNAHQQVTAPGYEMYYVWLIRHLDGDPWDKTRIYVPEYEWLANAD